MKPQRNIYRRCSSPLADDLEQIKQAIDEYKATCLFIDSLGLACGGDLNSAEPALRFFAALRQFKITSVILAHTARNTDSNNKHIYGSMFFEAQSRNVWELVKSNDDEDSIVIGLYHKKPPPFGKLHKPLGYKFTFDNDNNKTYFEYNDPKSVDELLERMGTNTKIIEALKYGPLTPKELEESKGIKNPRTALSRLKRKGIIIPIGKEAYGLVDKEHDPKVNNRNMLRNSVTQLRNVTQGDIYIVPCYGDCYGNFFHAGCGIKYQIKSRWGGELI